MKWPYTQFIFPGINNAVLRGKKNKPKIEINLLLALNIPSAIQKVLKKLISSVLCTILHFQFKSAALQNIQIWVLPIKFKIVQMAL